jgi:hypothetical protein
VGFCVRIDLTDSDAPLSASPARATRRRAAGPVRRERGNLEFQAPGISASDVSMNVSAYVASRTRERASRALTNE